MSLAWVEGQLFFSRHLSHWGRWGAHICWPNPTKSTLMSLHMCLGSHAWSASLVCSGFCDLGLTVFHVSTHLRRLVMRCTWMSTQIPVYMHHQLDCTGHMYIWQNKTIISRNKNKITMKQKERKWYICLDLGFASSLRPSRDTPSWALLQAAWSAPRKLAEYHTRNRSIAYYK